MEDHSDFVKDVRNHTHLLFCSPTVSVNFVNEWHFAINNVTFCLYGKLLKNSTTVSPVLLQNVFNVVINLTIKTLI